MTNVQQQVLIGIAAGAPLLAFVYTYCLGSVLPRSRQHWPAAASAAIVLAASAVVAFLLRDGMSLPADSIVRYRWLTLPGDNGTVELLWQFDAVSAIFLFAVNSAILCTLWIRADAFTSGDLSSRMRFLTAVTFLQFAIVLLLLACDWLSFFCSWQLIVIVIGGLDERSSVASHSRMDRVPDARVQSIAAAVMLFGVMLYWHSCRSFEFSAISVTEGMKTDSGIEIWGAGLCFFVAASARCSLVPFPVIRWEGEEVGVHDLQSMLSVLSLPMATILIVRALPLLHNSTTLMTLVMGLGAATALLGALRGAMETTTPQQLSACENSLIGLAVLGLGTFTPTAIVSALLLLATQIVAMTAMRLVSTSGQQTSAIQGWGYLVSAVILASGFWGQQPILAEVAQRIRESQSPFQEQILIAIYWAALASLPCLSFALTRGFFEMRRYAEVRSAVENIDGKAILWLLPMAAIVILLFVIDQSGQLIDGKGRPLGDQMRLGMSLPLEFDVGLPLVFLGAVVAWLFKSTADSSQVHPHGVANWIRNGFGLGRLWEHILGGPLRVLSTCCRVLDDYLLGVGGRELVQRSLRLSTAVSCELQTGRVQFYMLSILLVTAFLLLILRDWGM